MGNAARLLGFAFANADLLFEIDPQGTVVFASGAVSELLPGASAELVGHGIARLFHPADSVKFVTQAMSLGKGGRAGPLRVKLAAGGEAMISMCHLPQNGNNISCTLTRPGKHEAFGGVTHDTATGLTGKDSFLKSASAMAEGDHALTLVDVPDLPDACAQLASDQADQLMQRIGEVVRAAGTAGAGRVGETTFGAVTPQGKTSKLAASIAATLKDSGLDNPRVTGTLVSLAGGGLSDEQRLLAVRHVVSRFAQGKHDAKPGENLAAAFDNMVSETQIRAQTLTDTVLDGKFSLAYQPIIELADGSLAHCEALARFEDADETGETIAFAEALGISDAFDVAITAKVLAEVEAKPQARVALNISGGTLSSPSSFGLVAGLLAARRNLADRVLIEITETVQIDDLTRANQAIQGLRAMGYEVGLDDFGAGAASFQYLHAFDVDFVKFDNRLIRNLGQSRREDMLVTGLVKLCGELRIKTVAEGIENEDLLERVRAQGFTYGQGYHLGRPSQDLVASPAKAARNIRRKGTKESWG
jgi:EAL domain-containing protein (putative c-di-GMP-specific phosphodiesterase class I)